MSVVIMFSGHVWRQPLSSTSVPPKKFADRFVAGRCHLDPHSRPLRQWSIAFKYNHPVLDRALIRHRVTPLKLFTFHHITVAAVCDGDSYRTSPAITVATTSIVGPGFT